MNRLLFRGLLLLCVSWSVLGAAEEESNPAGSLLSRLQGDRSNGSGELPVELGACLLVKSSEGSGSAFFAELWNQPVIITNAHVFLAMNAPKITDLNGRSYQITEVIGVKNRDLVILAFAKPAWTPPLPLKLVDHIAALQPDTKVVAYGNSLGNGVISRAPGKIIGVGPTEIETDAGFVPGNSGGPLLNETNEVVGVATYLVKPASTQWVAGSRFEAGDFTPVVLRFATRIDNLTSDELEPLSIKGVADDRKLYRKMEDYQEELTRRLLALSSGRDQRRQLNALLSHLNKRTALFNEADLHTWTSSYLKREFDSKRSTAEELAALIMDDDELMSAAVKQVALAEGVENAVAGATARPIRGVRLRCFLCDGTGRYSRRVSNEAYDGHAVAAESRLIHSTCNFCRNGYREFKVASVQYQLSQEQIAVIDKLLEPSAGTFAGFRLGGDGPGEIRRFRYYSAPENLLFRLPNEFGETYLYQGCHASSTAVATSLIFMFGRLVAVEIVEPVNGQTSTSALVEGGRKNLQVSQRQIELLSEVPVDRRGKALLDPQDDGSTKKIVRAGRLQQGDSAPEDRYEGRILLGNHPVYKIIREGDLVRWTQKK